MNILYILIDQENMVPKVPKGCDITHIFCYFQLWLRMVRASCIRELPSNETEVGVNRFMHYRKSHWCLGIKPGTEKRRKLEMRHLN
jgi:hypothetical protein